MLFLSLHYISLRWRSQHLKRMENLYLERGFDQIDKLKARGTHTPTHGLASTSRMPTVTSLGQ